MGRLYGPTRCPERFLGWQATPKCLPRSADGQVEALFGFKSKLPGSSKNRLYPAIMQPSLSDWKAVRPASYKFKVRRPDDILAKCSSSNEVLMECALFSG